jgi:hypothetical protein
MSAGEFHGWDAVAAFNALAARENWEQQCDPTLAFVHSDFPRMLDVCRAQAGNKPMPARRSMTPRVLKDFLPRVAINERVSVSPPRFTWRLMGTHVAQVLGERTGKFIDEDAPPRQVARWNANLDLVLRVGRPLRFAGRVLANDKTYLASELLFMPLADDAGEPRFVMGFGHYELGIGRASKPPSHRPAELTVF